jgi:hypothetical protein
MLRGEMANDNDDDQEVSDEEGKEELPEELRHQHK